MLANLIFKTLIIFLLSAISLANAGEYEQYWDSWYTNAKFVKQCESEKRVALFIQNSIAALGNAERAEANAEVIETIILTKPACFLSALSVLPHDQCRAVVKFFIQAPIYHDAKQIEESLKSVHFARASCYVD